jgi:mRNA interferase RelE/StbE
LPDFRVFETKEFLKKLSKLPEGYPEIIRKKLQGYVYPQLKQEPFFGANVKKLRDFSPDTWRYRIGKFRLFYAVDLEERIIYILSVDLRRDAYR